VIAEGKYVTVDMKSCRADKTALGTSQTADAIIASTREYSSAVVPLRSKGPRSIPGAFAMREGDLVPLRGPSRPSLSNRSLTQRCHSSNMSRARM
jgi:hypothetical protein